MTTSGHTWESCPARQPKFRGARGAVIDGGARDTEYMFRLGLPVFARYKTPLDVRGRWRLVDWNVAIVIGSVAIAPGDLIALLSKIIASPVPRHCRERL